MPPTDTAVTDSASPETLTEAAASTVDAPADPAAAVGDLIATGDHKAIGRMWMTASALFLLAGLVIGAIAGFEHADLGGFAIAKDADQFTQLWSLGRDLVMFGGLVPMFVALAIAVVPLQVGASALAFSRGAAAAFWTWLAATGILILSYIMNGGPAGGQTDFAVLWALALATMLAAIVWALIAIATTVLGARTTGMSLERVPVSAWGFLLFAIIGILALPVVIGELGLAYIDIKYGYLPTDDSRFGLVGVLNSVSFAPAIYWLGVPTLGIAVEAISTHTGRPVRFHRSVLVALGILAAYSFAGDFFSFSWRGRPVDFDNGAWVLLVVVSIIPVLSTLALAGESLKKGTFKVRTPLVAGLLGGLVLLLGTVVAVLLVVAPVINFFNTNFDTGQVADDTWSFLALSSMHEAIRALVAGAGVLGAIAGVHHWSHKIWGRTLDDRAGLLSALAAAGGAVVWAAGSVVSGFAEQPMLPVVAESATSSMETGNLIAAIGIALLAAGAALTLLQVLGASAGAGSAVEPWRGATLEWATSSPPPIGNFPVAPVVSSATPLLDEDFNLTPVSDDTADDSGDNTDQAVEEASA